MRQIDFIPFIAKLEKLSKNQVARLFDKLIELSHSQSVSKLETDFSKLNCPHCESQSIGHWGSRNGIKRYRCKGCRKTFNSLTGTPLARLRKKHLWESYADGMLSQESLQEASDRLNINRHTAFKWRHRFLKNAKDIKPNRLGGVVENDETYFLESFKGCRLGLLRKAKKRGSKAKKRGLSSEQICVFVSRDRNGNTYDEIFKAFNSDNLTKNFAKHLDGDVLFYSDSKSVYKKFTKENSLNAETINLSKGEHVRNKVIHIQNINAYHSRLKDWVKQFRGVATEYLDSYLAWFRMTEEKNIIVGSELIISRAKSGGKYNFNP